MIRYRLALAVALVWLGAAPAHAFRGGLNDWLAFYAETPTAGVNAECQLCHGDSGGGEPWNAYGWDVKLSLGNPACDADMNGRVSNEEAFLCVEMLDSDGAPGANDNLAEIEAGSQPGWTLGANNTLFFEDGTMLLDEPAPGTVGLIDPDGGEPPPPPDDQPRKKLKKHIVVRPGQSIQAALDRAAPGATVVVKPGVYREPGDGPNALSITKSGIRLIGQTKKKKKGGVILRPANGQRNGIAVVAPEREDCMSCHTDLAPPFPLRDGVPLGMPKETDPWIYDIEVRGITIEGFPNNGLFTEHVDGFQFVDIHSVNNKNYGIFPVLSRNGIVTQSSATGSDDSGIWVETSENVVVTHNRVEANVNGFELSNSDDVLFAYNEASRNTVGFAILLLPDIFDDRPGARRITVRNNRIYDNNKPNTAPGGVLSAVPQGIGILHIGPDDSVIADNWIADNDFAGFAVTDYCLAVLDTEFSCERDDNVTPEFFLDQTSANNQVLTNTFVNNGTDPVDHPFDFAAADMSLITFSDWGNCFEDNVFGSFFRFFGFGGPPACE